MEYVFGKKMAIFGDSFIALFPVQNRNKLQCLFATLLIIKHNKFESDSINKNRSRCRKSGTICKKLWYLNMKLFSWIRKYNETGIALKVNVCTFKSNLNF